MKYILLTVLLVITQSSYAHTWDADQWAEDQLIVTNDIANCVSLLVEEVMGETKVPGEDCDLDALAVRVDNLHKQLTAAVNKHPKGTTLRMFIDSDFKDTEQAERALMIMPMAMEALSEMILIANEYKEY